MTDACAYWAITFAVWMPLGRLLGQDQLWGGTSMRQALLQRIATFGRTAAAGTLAYYPAFADDR